MQSERLLKRKQNGILQPRSISVPSLASFEINYFSLKYNHYQHDFLLLI